MEKAKINYQKHNILPYFLQGWTSKLATILSWLIAAILVLLPFHALLTTWAGSSFGHLDAWRIWKEILLAAALPFFIWLVWRTPELKKWLTRSWIVRLFGIYVLLHIILGAWVLLHHQVSTTALAYALIINLRFIYFFVFCVAVGTVSTFLKNNWRKILLAPAGVVIVFGLVQKLFLPFDFLKHFGYSSKTIPAYQTVDANLDFRRIQSTLRGANPLGAYLVLLVPALWLGLRKVWGKWLAVSAAAVVLFFTYSRSGEIGTAIALALLVWWGIGKKISGRQIAALLVTLVVAATGFVYIFRNSQLVQDTLFHTSSSSTSSRSSNADRLASMENGARDIIHQPLGRGPGTAGPASARNDHPARIAENYFLQIGQEVGVAGIILFMAINYLIAKELWARRADQLAKILLASLVGITFVNLLSHAWTDDTISYIWWGLAGVAIATPAVISKK